MTGPGFQMAQKFVENVFEQHIDWVEIVKNDDNFKNILQVKIQKEFKVTPEYVELKVNSEEEGYYRMGVFLCIGDEIYNMNIDNAIAYEEFGNFAAITEYLKTNETVLVFLGEGKHKLKRRPNSLRTMML